MDEDPNKKNKGKRLASEAAPTSEMDPKKPRPLLEASSIADNFQQMNAAAAAAAAADVVMDSEEPEVQSQERIQTHGEIMHNFSVGCQDIIERARKFNEKLAGCSASKKQGGDDKDNKGKDK